MEKKRSPVRDFDIIHRLLRAGVGGIKRQYLGAKKLLNPLGKRCTTTAK